MQEKLSTSIVDSFFILTNRYNYIKSAEFMIISKYTFKLLIIMLLFASAGCSNDEPSGEKTDEEAGNIDITVYPATTSDGITPRMCIIGDDYTLTEIYNPDNADIITYHYLCGVDNISALLIASQEGIWIVETDPMKPSAICTTTSIHKHGESYIIETGSYNPSDKKYTRKSIQRYASASPRYANDGMDFARKGIHQNILDPLIKSISKMPEALPSEAASDISDAWQEAGEPVMELHLYSNDPDKIIETTQKYTNEFGKIIIAKTVKALTPQIVKDLYRCSVAGFLAGGKLVDDEDLESQYPGSWSTGLANAYAAISYQLPSQFDAKIYDEADRYHLSVSIQEVAKTSALISGSFYDTGYTSGFVSSTGYILYKNNKEIRRINTSLEANSYLLTGLTAGETYAICSYATVSGITYCSESKVFTTEADFDLSADEVTFTEDGGSETIQITLPTPEWESYIENKPDWCKADISGNNLTIKVGKSSESREGIIDVVGVNKEKNLEYVKSVKVVQKVIGNYLVFQGNIRYTTETTGEDSYTTDIPVVLIVTRNGGKTTISGSLPASGIYFQNWTVGNGKPSILHESETFTSFNCSNNNNIIKISGTAGRQSGSTTYSSDFSITIDINSLIATINDKYSVSDRGSNGKTTKVTLSGSGSIKYADQYQQ